MNTIFSAVSHINTPSDIKSYPVFFTSTQARIKELLTPIYNTTIKVDILSSLVKEEYRRNWLHSYMNWYAEDIESEIEYADFCHVWCQIQDWWFFKSDLKSCLIEKWVTLNILLYLGQWLQK